MELTEQVNRLSELKELCDDKIKFMEFSIDAFRLLNTNNGNIEKNECLMQIKAELVAYQQESKQIASTAIRLHAKYIIEAEEQLHQEITQCIQEIETLLENIDILALKLSEALHQY